MHVPNGVAGLASTCRAMTAASGAASPGTGPPGGVRASANRTASSPAYAIASATGLSPEGRR